MKKTWLFLIASLLCIFTLAWCENGVSQNDNEKLSEEAQFCLDNWWTYSNVISQTEKYWECKFPSGVTCRDEILMTEKCNFSRWGIWRFWEKSQTGSISAWRK